MSITHDAMTAFKNTFLAVIQRPDEAPIELEYVGQTSPPTAPTLDQSLLAVARENAHIRGAHSAILGRTASLTSLHEDLLSVFDRAYQTLDQLAEARSQLAKAEAVSKFEHEERESIGRRLHSMTASYHQTVGEVEKLRPELRRLEGELKQTSDRLAVAEADNLALADQLKEAQADGERRRTEEARARREQEAVHADLLSANAYIEQKLSEIIQLTERCEIAEQASRASARALDETRGERATALMQLDEKRVNLANAQSRIAALETQLSDLGDKFSAARSVWSLEAEGFNDAISRLKSDLAQAHGRDEAHQRLLAAAQADVSSLRRQCADLDGQIAEAKMAAAHAFTRAESAETARAQIESELAASKRLHHSLLRRVKPMISALRKKSAEVVRLNTTLADFERRFDAFQMESVEAIRALKDQEINRVGEMEIERARRVVAEGALAIDRGLRPFETPRGKGALKAEESASQISENPRQT